MQAAGGGGGGPGRSPAVGPGRSSGGGGSSSSAASPSSSSSAVSAPHLGGFDAAQQQQQLQHQQQQQLQHRQQQQLHHQQQQQQQQQYAFRQSLQQQQLRKSEGDETLVGYHAGGIHGVIGSGTSFLPTSGAMSAPQQSRRMVDLSQQQCSSQGRDEKLNQNSGPEQHVQNPMHHAYMQYAFQAAQQKSHGNMVQVLPQGNKMGVLGPPGKDQDMRMNNLKMQELMSLQAGNHAQASAFKKSSEAFEHGQKQLEQGQTSDSRPPQSNIIRSAVQAQQPAINIANLTANQFAMAQLQAMQAWAVENNIDLSHPNNANLIAQFLPVWQSRMAAVQKSNVNSGGHLSQPLAVKQQNNVSSSPVASENPLHGNPVNELKTRQIHSPVSFTSAGPSTMVNSKNIQLSRPIVSGSGIQAMHPPQPLVSVNQSVDSSQTKNSGNAGPEPLQVQYMKQVQQLSRAPVQATGSSSENPGIQFSPQGGVPVAQVPQQHVGFTKQQLHVLKAQILAFRRLKRGEGSLPQEVLQSIAPPPLDQQMHQIFTPPVAVNEGKTPPKSIEEQTRNVEANVRVISQIAHIPKGQSLPKEESSFPMNDKTNNGSSKWQGSVSAINEPIPNASAATEEQSQISSGTVKSEQETEHSIPKVPVKEDSMANRGKTSPQQATPADAMQAKQVPQKEVAPPRKYYGPLFDFSYFTRRHDSFGSAVTANNMGNLTMSFDVRELLSEEGAEVLTKRREENLKKIGSLLAVNLERKRIRPDLVVRLQIEERKLRLVNLQSRLRDEMESQQQEIMAMPDRPYKKFVRLCERQRMELVKQVQMSQKALREKQLKSIFQWRKRLLEAHWAIRDARTARNRGVAKYHERMLREFSKRKDDDRNKRMEALKNNDVDRYREMLLEQQTNISGDASQRYAVLSSFLSQTEEYLQKLGGKITAAKNHQEIEEAANAAAAAARSQGLSEEEVRAAAACAGEEVMIRNRFSEMNAPKDNSTNKYYNLAHAVNEKVIRQPSMLRAGTLRDYQLIGLQWMLSLYNNKLNGILADEMGLGKTVQVMSLIAYLMEFKGNYGPHLIIVPNAVLVNWKSELHNWLPSVTCIYYVGAKEQRSKLFSQEVCAMKFNVLVTTYEFVMYDRNKLSKVDWKYIIIDEAQRMKDRDSVLARDLDRYRSQRRLLLTGTPLQNDLKELWSLLNLLLPEVFDNRKAFHDWFSKPFQKDGSSESVEDDWLETEKKVIIIHRLHQILEPFMLRRRVEDVEGSLPAKVSIVLRCKMSALQGAIYDWIKSTGTIRVDPEDELLRMEKNPMYQIKTYKNLNNKCMELRKACIHPLLNYPYFSQYSRDFIVRSCGKLWVLDRILIKLHRAGHRVLLFSTMTKLLDILEEYLLWRRLAYRRIDGTTSLEDRESAIVEFNSPDSNCFIFLLSIRAAGRGLNLQTADTVVIYDPDPNPKNEEQAVARAHRIGQKREVKVIYMEAVVDKISSHQKEDELRSGGMVDMEDDFAGKDRYIGSIESLIRNNIQQYKIDMADEVINAGRFDQRTTHEERRMTLETLLHDEERYQENVHDVPSLQEVNRMIARSEEEVELFDQMDEEFDWVGEMIRHDQVPDWLRAGSSEVNELLAKLSKKSLKRGVVGNVGVESREIDKDSSPNKTDRRGRPKGPKNFSYRELDDENGEDFEASSEEGNGYGLHEEEGEIGDFEEESSSGAADVDPGNKDHSEEGDPLCDGVVGYETSRIVENVKNDHILEEAISTASSSESRRLAKVVTPPIACQKFGSLSALDARSDSLPRKMADELEEGEIAVSGDSHMDYQQSGSWVHERDDGEEQVIQPKIKRKRSIRFRPRYNIEKLEERSNGDGLLTQRAGSFSHLPMHVERQPYDMQVRAGSEQDAYSDPNASDSHDPVDLTPKLRRSISSRKGAGSIKWNAAKPTRLNIRNGPPQDVAEQSRENWDAKASPISGRLVVNSGAKMPEIVQRKCKNVNSKFQRRIDKDGHQIAPLITDLWKRIESSYMGANDILDLHKIDQNIDRSQYSGVMEFVADVQLMLKSSAQNYGCSDEVRTEARKLQDVFFDILKIAFPDTDFREARSGLLFSGPALAAPPSSKQAGTSQIKRHKMINVSEQERGPAKQMPRRPTHTADDPRNRNQAFKLQKETRVASVSPRNSEPLDDTTIPAHPGQLVICKKKRNDREKAPVRSGPTSPAAVGRVPLLGSSKQTQQGPTHSYAWPQRSAPHPPPKQQHVIESAGAGGVNEAQWAKPVKRLRTDTGKRRPSQL